MKGRSESSGRRRISVRAAVLASVAVIVMIACTGVLFANGFLFLPTGSLSSGLAGVTLYVVGIHGRDMTALRASDGAVRWRYDGGGGDTAAADGMVFTTPYPDGVVSALRSSDGSLLWSGGTVGGVLVAGDGIVCVESFDRPPHNPSHVTALNASDGSVRWSFTLDGPYRPNATIADNVVYIYGGGVADASKDVLYALQVADGKLLWKTMTSFSDSPAPAVAGGVVYVADLDGYVNAVRARDGVVLWQVATGTNGASSTLATGPGAVYASSADGYIVALNAADGARLWRHALEPSTSPTAANGVVYVNTYGGDLVALNARNGAELWRSQVHGEPDDFARPVVVDGAVFEGLGGGCFVICFPGHVYGVRARDGEAAWRVDTGEFTAVVVA